MTSVSMSRAGRRCREEGEGIQAETSDGLFKNQTTIKRKALIRSGIVKREAGAGEGRREPFLEAGVYIRRDPVAQKKKKGSCG